MKLEKCLYTIWKRRQVTNNEYLKHFDSKVTILETFGGELPNHPLLAKKNLIEAGVNNPNYASESEQKRAEKASVEDYLACLMPIGADNGRYQSLKNNLENSMLLGSDNYPKSREE